MILSGLKTWLETGETLTTPGSLMYSRALTAHHARRTTMQPTTITDIRTIGVTVSDQDAALDFYVGTLGFEKRLDAPISPTMRWIEVAPRGATTSIALTHAGEPAGRPTPASGSPCPTPRPSTQPLHERGVRSASFCAGTGVPPMFEFDDPDGNRFYVVEESR